MAAIDALKDDSVIVFINGLTLYDTPELVQESMTSGPALGEPLPIIATFDAAIQKQLGVVGYTKMKGKDAFTEVKTALAKNRGNGAAPENQVKSLPEMWEDNQGRPLRATYVNSTGEDVTLRLKDGNLSTLKLATLSEASQKRVAELAKN